MKRSRVNDICQNAFGITRRTPTALIIALTAALPALLFFPAPSPAGSTLSAVTQHIQPLSTTDAGRFTVSGTVLDESNAAPIGGARLAVKGGNVETFSAADGKFSLILAERGKLTLLCTAAAYGSIEKIVSPGPDPIVIRLRRQGITVVAAEEIAPVTKPAPMLEGKIAGVVVSTGHAKRLERLMETEKVVSIMPYDNSAPHGNLIYNEPPFNTEGYDPIRENRFLSPLSHPLSTFSIDVDGASYSNVRRFLRAGQLPPPGAVRIEELINYFPYHYAEPRGEHPFAIHTELTGCPWKPGHNLVRIGLQGKKMPVTNLPAANLVFLIDVSGSMMDENKLPLVKSSMKLLVDQLREQDRVAIVVYAGNAGLVLPSTAATQPAVIKDAIDRLEAGGSTAGGAGIKLAYRIARENFVQEGNNRIILCTDGDFNVGASSDAAMEKMISEERASGVYLTVLGYGMGNYKDNKMQQLAGKGNGNHAYIDNLAEARKVLVNEFGGTLFTIAGDVKLQVEFNPLLVEAYRLIGYENRLLQHEDFNDDKKDAGELGSGHAVTALYEIIPVGIKTDLTGTVDSLKYQRARHLLRGHADELLTIKFRYKKPGEEISRLITQTVADKPVSIQEVSGDFRFTVAVAQYGMLLNNAEFRGEASFESAERLAGNALGEDRAGYRREFIELVRTAARLQTELSRAGASR